MLQNTKITFIGPGAMAEAMLSGILKHKLTEPANILASGPLVDRNTELREKYHPPLQILFRSARASSWR